MERVKSRKKSPAIRSVRFAPQLYERIAKDAKANYRNFSQQVILLIERGLEAENDGGKAR